METRPLSAHVMPRRWSLGRAFAHALLLSLIPLGTAAAQPYAAVQVTRDKTEIECFGRLSKTCMTAQEGTVLEVLYIDGDRYNHKDSNWYWVLLPRDEWGRRVTGWIRGDDVAHVPPAAPTLASASAMPANLAETSRATDARGEPRDTAMPSSAEAAPAARAIISDVVVTFEFDKSSLTDEARQKLESSIVWTTTPGQGLTVALAGHADGIGREAYNDRLGSARAETVKRYLMEQLGLPADSISVVSYGEKQPVAPNTTRAGRAQNRRVEIKGGGSSAGPSVTASR
jgi:outer membrane protein OmpA-like peptidoglycan-associated protein